MTLRAERPEDERENLMSPTTLRGAAVPIRLWVDPQEVDSGAPGGRL